MFRYLSKIFGLVNENQSSLPAAVNIYAKKNRILVAATNSSGHLRAPSNRLEFIELASSPEFLGEIVLKLLAQSRTDVIESCYKDELQEFFCAADVEGWDGLSLSWPKHAVVYSSSGFGLEMIGYNPCKSGGYATNRQPIEIDKSSKNLGALLIEIIQEPVHFFDQD